MEEKYRSSVVLAVGSGLGLLIGWIDSRPHWDDTGITVALILGVSAVLGFAAPKRPWINALSVGIWIPVWNIALNDRYGSLAAIVIAFIGAFVGAFVRKLISSHDEQIPPASRTE